MARALRQARLTALQKRDGGIRGIATGESLRRLVARTLAQTYVAEIEKECAPFQFALSTRAVTDCVGHLARAATELEDDLVVVSLDGIGAYDHIRRSSMLGKLRQLPAAQAMLPFVLMFYGSPSTYTWFDDDGVPFEVNQSEGGEQGDPLMPALYALGQHDALQAARAELHADDVLVAFLDDLYLLTSRSRVKRAIEIVTGKVAEMAGVQPHLGKLQAWSPSGGPAPPGLADLSATAWEGSLPEELNGIKVLGAPLGQPAFVKAHLAERLHEEQAFLEQLPDLPDLQCAWSLLLYCAVPRANHLLRLLPPSQSAEYARKHDDEIRCCLSKLLQQPRTMGRHGRAWQLASMPLRLGGAGLRSAERTAPAAYWAAWADALPMLQERQPQLAAQFCSELQQESPAADCLREAAAAGQLLEGEGWSQRPSWAQLLAGVRPEPEKVESESSEAEPGEWRHGWQFRAGYFLETCHREFALRPRLSETESAMLHSSSGPGARYWLSALPTSKASRLSPALFQVALRRRLRMRLVLGARRCPGRCCRKPLDALGDHLAACSRSGLLQRRAVPLERAWTQVLKEAGARVVPQRLLCDLDLALCTADDGRRIDAVAYGLPFYGGVPLCGDATMVSPLHSNGSPWRGAADVAGLRLRAARKRKEQVYPELARGDGGRLVLLGCEIGGRWAEGVLKLLSGLAWCRCQEAPAILRRSARFAWRRRWLCHLSIAAQGALAASLAEPAALWGIGPAAEEPPAGDVLCSWRAPPSASRLPLR